MIVGTVQSLEPVGDIQTPGQDGKAFPRHAILAGFVASEGLWRLQSQVVGQHSGQEICYTHPDKRIKDGWRRDDQAIWEISG